MNEGLSEPTIIDPWEGRRFVLGDLREITRAITHDEAREEERIVEQNRSPHQRQIATRLGFIGLHSRHLPKR